METVAAVVVTFNRLNDLKICIDTLRAQTRKLDLIYVINNGSTDGTDAWLATQPDLLVTTQTNLGGAGGFATGIKTAYEGGSTWLWCMDDDCVAAPDALQKLLESPNLGSCIKNSMSVSAKDHNDLAFYVDRPNRTYRTVSDMTQYNLVYGVASFFNGTLIHTEVVKTIGTPDVKLFIRGDDMEYMTRAIKNGFPVVTVPASIFYHPPSFERIDTTWSEAWKQYYAVRNQRRVFQNVHGNAYGMAIFAKWAFGQTLEQARTKGKNRFYNFLIFSEAAIDSMMNNFRKRPDNILTIRLYKYMHK